VTTYDAADVSLQLKHVATCLCRYAIVDGEDVKVIDVRCISAYLVPDPKDPA
jgi:hypothetical protein